ncbi:Holliday junction branch migration protein RuvA [Mangrovibacillus cuniculi]|uniref:Holliday junction branch migration complex subunit RuvA n=1 Tax=Mangrovibacillus cuniculi TaxID=2593652 RepID=A0A7S8CBQ3_9BACI|nr:Holliday junction branch migration protein RuvA [Mangrovibacillus cuniculi]QPC47026.1 Holliday junction branch migration protein RuvA [Mangrovibacillus cuniculi]
MYAYITGTVDYISPEHVVIDHQGIGYEIMTPNPFVYTTGKEVKVFTYHYVREDTQALYGFQTFDEKWMFTKLLNVSGIGPKGALAILASGQPNQVIQAIESENETFLVKFPGIGKKTARQMILDLKGKLNGLGETVQHSLFTAEQDAQMEEQVQSLEEAILALQALGYSEREIKKLRPKMEKEQLTTDGYIKLALKHLLT